MAIDFGKKTTPTEKTNALRKSRPYTEGGAKYPKPTSKPKITKNALKIEAKF